MITGPDPMSLARVIREYEEMNLKVKVADQAALIRELVGALELATKYVEATHKSIAPLVGAGSAVLPDLSRCRLALSRVPEEYRG